LPANNPLEIEAVASRLRNLEKELYEQESLADLGELTGPATHEMSNFLNSLLLQVAVLELQAPENARGELAEIRRQGNEMSAMLRSLQDYHKLRRAEVESVDLNSVVVHTVHEFGETIGDADQLRTPVGTSQGLFPLRTSGMSGSCRIALDLGSDPITVAGNCTDLRRLCVFLLRNAMAATNENNGSVTVRTERSPDKALLRVEDTGPPVSTSRLAQLFEPHIACRVGTNSLELAACQSLVRRFGGRIHAESGSECGLSICVQLPPAPRTPGS
jgi:signal transduction histidine kinase